MVRENIDKKMEAAVIELASSEWASLIVLVSKNEGSFLFCVDYRRLNTASAPKNYLPPRISDCIDSQEKAEVVTALDAL